MVWANNRMMIAAFLVVELVFYRQARTLMPGGIHVVACAFSELLGVYFLRRF